MSLFNKLGRSVGKFVETARSEAEAHAATYRCGDCGARIDGDADACPDCGSTDLERIEE